jgi:glutathione S-transferase
MPRFPRAANPGPARDGAAPPAAPPEAVRDDERRATMKLILGNKATSTWSLRAWLVCRAAGLTPQEETIRLRRPETAAEIRARVPSGKVPALVDGDLMIWDSLAIAEYLAERVPEAGLWPDDPAARAVARAGVAEMHAGFASLRRTMPMDLQADHPGEGMTAETAGDIARIVAIWDDARQRFGGEGPFLFGARFTIADAVWTPVASRFATYAVALPAPAAAYRDTLMDHVWMREWRTAAAAEAPPAGASVG